MMKQVLGCLLAAGLTVVIAACGHNPQQTTTANGEPASYALAKRIDNITFTPDSWPEALQADLWLPERADPAPVVMLVHGGGWYRRDRSDMDSIAEKLVEAGFAAFNVSYRFAPTHTFPAQLDDLMQAKRWLHQHSGAYQLQGDRISAWGYSAGAQLVALMASVNSSVELKPGQRPIRHQDQPKVIAVVAGGIPSDLRRYPQSPLVNDFLGGTGSELPAVYEQASPMAQISADDAAVFLYHGEKDFLVDVTQATDYHEALKAAGLETELYLHPWREHNTMFIFANEAERKAINFLRKQHAR